jgi:hypothetical protein
MFALTVVLVAPVWRMVDIVWGVPDILAALGTIRISPRQHVVRVHARSIVSQTPGHAPIVVAEITL